MIYTFHTVFIRFKICSCQMALILASLLSLLTISLKLCDLQLQSITPVHKACWRNISKKNKNVLEQVVVQCEEKHTQII